MSQLRCRPRDLAVVVGPGVETPGLLGRFVVVDRAARTGERTDLLIYSGPGIAAWVCRPAAAGATLPIRHQGGVLEMRERVITDHILRPIRPSDGEDETLQWAGKPKDLSITRPEAFDYQAYARERAGEGA